MQILIQKQCHDLLLFRDQNNNETNRLVTQNARTFYGRRTNVTGEGIFTFYSEDAKRILSKYEELCCRGTIEVIHNGYFVDDNNQIPWCFKWMDGNGWIGYIRVGRGYLAMLIMTMMLLKTQSGQYPF